MVDGAVSGCIGQNKTIDLMNTRILLVTFLTLWVLSSWAQRPCLDKMSPLLRHIVRQQSHAATRLLSLRTSPSILSFVKLTDPQVLADHGCVELTHVGQVYVASIPVNQLTDFSADPRVLRIEARQGNSIANDRMASILNALPAYEGVNLPQAYTGKDVVMGVMDVGFDLTHPTFYARDTTQYRIHQFWDMLSQDTVSSPFVVGRDYVGRETLLALGHSRDGYDETHGTHTVGIAAGSGYDAPYRGMAPDADICLVANAVSSNMHLIKPDDLYKYTFATDFLGFKYMADYAKSVGKPCVLSFSEGSMQDFWGYDQLYYEMIDSLVGPGCIMVAAAGNNGHVKSWWRKEAGEASKGTFLNHGGDMLISTLTSPDDFDIRIVYYGNGNDTILIHTSEVCVLPDSLYTFATDGEDSLIVEAYPSCYTPGTTCYDVVFMGPSTIGISRPLSLEVLGREADVEFWRYNGNLYTNQALNPSLNAGETVRSILSPSSSPRVICVGATTHRDSIQNVNGTWMKYWTGETGTRTPFSSVGPTFDGRTKPDVMAPGNNIISSYNSFYREKNPHASDLQWDVNTFDFEGRTYSWNANTGTSMACPAVAGAIALWLQAKPDLTPEDILGIIQRTSRHPDLSLDYPNNLYGYGEIDVYRGLLEILGINKIETVSNHHTSARIVLDNGSLMVVLPGPLSVPLQLRLYNMSGSLVKATALESGQSLFTIPLTHLAAGIYAVQLDGHAAVRGSTLIRL